MTAVRDVLPPAPMYCHRRRTRHEMFYPTGMTGTIVVRSPANRTDAQVDVAAKHGPHSTVSNAAVKSSRQRADVSTIGRKQQIIVDLRDRSLCAVEATICRLHLRHEVVAVEEDLESTLDDPLQ